MDVGVVNDAKKEPTWKRLSRMIRWFYSLERSRQRRERRLDLMLLGHRTRKKRSQYSVNYFPWRLNSVGNQIIK